MAVSELFLREVVADDAIKAAIAAAYARPANVAVLDAVADVLDLHEPDVFCVRKRTCRRVAPSSRHPPDDRR